MNDSELLEQLEAERNEKEGKYIVQYKFLNDPEIYTKSFRTFVEALQCNRNIISKYKNNKKKQLDYCVYMEVEQ